MNKAQRIAAHPLYRVVLAAKLPRDPQTPTRRIAAYIAARRSESGYITWPPSPRSWVRLERYRHTYDTARLQRRAAIICAAHGLRDREQEQAVADEMCRAAGLVPRHLDREYRAYLSLPEYVRGYVLCGQLAQWVADADAIYR